CTLSAREVVDLVTRGLEALAGQGVSVRMPALDLAQAEGIRIRVQVRPRRGRRRTRREHASGGWFHADQLVEFDWTVVVDEREISREEFERMVERQSPLVELEGSWRLVPLEAIVQQIRLFEDARRSGSAPLLPLSRALLMAEEDEQVAEVLELAQAVEGLPRHASVHAAGVVIANRPLIEQVPLQRTADNAVVTQFTMEALEDLGLLKMDFLALRTLTVIHDCLRIIKATEGKELALEAIPLDDPDTYRLLARGDALGVFQLESGWVRDVLRDLKPSRFEDLIATVALCRPGPMERIPEFISGKNGEPRYPHPRLVPILRETYGVMIYQEQVMQVVSELAGFSLAQADVLRRAMGKKKPELIASLKEQFLRGAVERGVEPEAAEEIFSSIDRFAGYGFNKSHAAAYALVAYQTAYLKAHHPLAYMAALLTSVMGSADKVAVYIEECRRMGIRVLPPDINQSYSHFTVTPDGLRFGLAAVKNVGEGAIESILEARRRDGPFLSLRDFCERVDTRLLNKRAVESLIKAGAFDGLNRPRAQLLQALDRTLEAAQELHRRRQAGQLSLFEGEGRAAGFGSGEEDLPEVEEFPPGRRLAMEKEVLGFYITGHPLSGYAEELKASGVTGLERLPELQDGARVKVAGLVTAVKRVVTRSGQIMAFLTLEDMVGSVEVLVFPKVYERCVGWLESDSVVLVTGRVSVQEEQVKVAADEVSPLTARRRVYVRVPAALPAGAAMPGSRQAAPGKAATAAGEGVAAGGGRGAGRAGARAVLEAIRRVLAGHRGPSPVYLHLPRGHWVEVGRELWVEAGQGLAAELEALLGPGSVRLEG
ncbi:MAG: DNA polymerase III subunit alpha, partial [Acetobacteraceae bacterium]|nr:DNA polymerase III subunit alpha [Acetobacteraceae bacterium]